MPRSEHISGHFQTWVRQPSNVDRCERCHLPRSVHGPDWTCPPRPSNRVAAALVVLGATLTVAGIVIRVLAGSSVQPGRAMLMADATLLGILLVIGGITMLGSRS